MDFANEFKLLSCKVAFRCDDDIVDDVKLYQEHCTDIVNPHDLFLPDCQSDVKSTYATDELRIRKWLWKEEYELLDVNSWLQDVETGVIGIRVAGCPNDPFELVAVVDDASMGLSWVSDKNIFGVFESRLEFFSHIRFLSTLDDVFLDANTPEDMILLGEIDKFIQSKQGKEAVLMEEAAYAEYEQALNDIDE